MKRYIASDSIAPPPDGLRPHEFFLIRYVPDVVRGEFVNIGVVLRETSTTDLVASKRFAFALTEDWRRVCEMFPNTDLEFLQETGNILRMLLRSSGTSGPDPVMQFDTARDQLSLSLQMTDPQGCLTSDMEVQLKLLMSMYVDSRRTEVFMGVGESVPAARYTDPWDGFIIDCGYSTDTVTRFYQAVSIEEDDQRAFALARRAEALREGVRRVEGKPLDLNAVVEAPPEGSSDGGKALVRYHHAVDSMRAVGITVFTVDELADVALRARRELGLAG